MTDIRVTEEQIRELLTEAEIEVETAFDKCTVVTVRLANGFIMTESSACVDPANYDEDYGTRLCLEHIENRLWELEGYVLQKAIYEQKCRQTELQTKNEREGRPLERVIAPGVYRHFKGGLYRVLTVAVHSETGGLEVIYQNLFPEKDPKVYARPYDMFAGEADRGKYPGSKQRYRFERMSEALMMDTEMAE